jgi:heavy metal sensor kinase
MRRPLSIRFRLTIWYVGAMLVVLAVYAAAVFAFVSRSASASLDERLHEDYMWASDMLYQRPDGRIEWPGSRDANTSLEDSPWLQVWSPGGELLEQTLHAQLKPVPTSDILAAKADGSIVSVPDTTPPTRVLSRRSTVGKTPVIIQVARDEISLREQLGNLLFVLLLGLPLGVAAAGLGGYTLARRALAPVERMADRARSITAERLKDRLPVDNPNDELGRLATVFNETLTRLEMSFDQMSRFTADASHELRTPLTAIRTVGEVGLRGRRDEAAYREIIGSMLEEVDRLSLLVDRLLTLSRAETGQEKLTIDIIELGNLADEVADQLGVLAEEKGQSIVVEHAAQPRWMGDPLVLRQALLNLVDNAIKYTPEGGRITIRVDRSAAGAIIDVVDDGPGIPLELQRRIFDRFYRVDKSRSREKGGTGLGLSIAKSAVEINGGRLTLEPGHQGSTFRITLPHNLPSQLHTPSLRAVK